MIQEKKHRFEQARISTLQLQHMNTKDLNQIDYQYLTSVTSFK